MFRIYVPTTSEVETLPLNDLITWQVDQALCSVTGLSLVNSNKGNELSTNKRFSENEFSL